MEHDVEYLSEYFCDRIMTGAPEDLWDAMSEAPFPMQIRTLLRAAIEGKDNLDMTLYTWHILGKDEHVLECYLEYLGFECRWHEDVPKQVTEATRQKLRERGYKSTSANTLN